MKAMGRTQSQPGNWGKAWIPLLVLAALTTGCVRLYTGATSLHFAARDGDIARAKRLLDKGVDVNVDNEGFLTPLCYAARKGRLDMCRFLLGRGAVVEPYNAYIGPMEWAAQGGYIDVAEVLLEHGATVNKGLYAGPTPLMHAARHGQLQMVRFLLAKGAAVNHRGTNDRTALHEAAYGGDADVVKCLLAAGADPTVQLSGHVSPPEQAMQAGHPEIAELIRSHTNTAQPIPSKP
jgi:ankyrin repeat protein